MRHSCYLTTEKPGSKQAAQEIFIERIFPSAIIANVRGKGTFSTGALRTQRNGAWRAQEKPKVGTHEHKHTINDNGANMTLSGWGFSFIFGCVRVCVRVSVLWLFVFPYQILTKHSHIFTHLHTKGWSGCWWQAQYGTAIRR